MTFVRFAASVGLARNPVARMSLQCRAAFPPPRPITVVPQRAKNLLGVQAVPRFHGDVELGALGRNVEEQPMMFDAENIGAKLAEPACDLPQNSGPIGDG